MKLKSFSHQILACISLFLLANISTLAMEHSEEKKSIPASRHTQVNKDTPLEKAGFDSSKTHSTQQKTSVPKSTIQKQSLEQVSPPPQNSLPSQKNKKKKKKNPLSQMKTLKEEIEDPQETPSTPPTSIVHSSQDSMIDTLAKVEPFIKQVLQEKKAEPLLVNVCLDREKIGEFYDAFSKLRDKYPFPFTWNSLNKGPSDVKEPKSPYILELRLSSLARAREQVENEFIYKVSPQEDKRVDWSLIYTLVMRSGFSLEDFNFNNSLKVRLLELKSTSEEKKPIRNSTTFGNEVAER